MPQGEPFRYADFQYRHALLTLLERIAEGIESMALSQQDFDVELAGLVSAVSELDQAVEALIASQPPGTDLTAEGQSVLDATQALKDELGRVQAAVTPAQPATPPAEGSPPA